MKKSVLALACIGTLLCSTWASSQNANRAAASNKLKITTDGVTEEVEAGASAQAGLVYTCALNNQQRRVEIVLSAAPAPVPCQVNYYKDTEANGAMETLWQAQNTAGFCEQQASALVAKLESMGWQCGNN